MKHQCSVGKPYYIKGLERKSFFKTIANTTLMCYSANVKETIYCKMEKEENKIEK